MLCLHYHKKWCPFNIMKIKLKLMCVFTFCCWQVCCIMMFTADTQKLASLLLPWHFLFTKSLTLSTISHANYKHSLHLFLWFACGWALVPSTSSSTEKWCPQCLWFNIRPNVTHLQRKYIMRSTIFSQIWIVTQDRKGDVIKRWH